MALCTFFCSPISHKGKSKTLPKSRQSYFNFKVMKKLILILTLLCSPIPILLAQEDIYGVKVTQNGNSYKATMNRKSDNGGTGYEVWSGTLVNGRREGTWKFEGKYELYGPTNNVFWSGTTTIIKEYKNGIPHGIYKVTDNLTVRNGGYNIYTNQWVYQQPVSANATLVGAFDNGKFSGSWNIVDGTTKFVATFKNGMPDGKFSYTDVNNRYVNATFSDGYVEHMKSGELNSGWWYEIDYGGQDPKQIQPQKTYSLFNVNFKLKSSLCGIHIGRAYFEKYPEDASDDYNVQAPYIAADVEKYQKPMGNLPQYMLYEIEYKRNVEKERKISEISDRSFQKMQSLANKAFDSIPNLSQFIMNAAFHKYGEIKQLFIDEYSSNLYQTCPEFKAANDSIIQLSGEGNIWFRQYETPNSGFTDWLNQQYLSMFKQFNGGELERIEPVLTKYKWIELVATRKFDYFIDSIRHDIALDTLQITEEDIQYYLVYKYAVNAPNGFTTFKMKVDDASDITETEVKEFVLKYNRQYSIPGETVKILNENLENPYSSYNKLENAYSELKDRKMFKKLRKTMSF